MKSTTQGKSEIGLWTSTALVVGNMTGSGIFLLPAALALYGGISLFGWLLTSIGAVFLALVFSRLSRFIPKAGGPYAYVKEGLGDFMGFIVVWGYWVSIWCGNAAISVSGVGYLSVFVPGLKENNFISALLAILAIWVFTFINFYNIKKVGKVQIITTAIKIIPLIAFGTAGFFYFHRENFIPFNVSDKSTFGAITSSAALSLWAFLGLESATIPSDKIKKPHITIPQATILGTVIAALLYISSTMAVMGIINPTDLQNSSAPFADSAKVIWGNWGLYAVAIGAAISCFGALNGWILLQGQMPFAAANDKLFPSVFGKVSKKNIPTTGLIIASILASVLVIMNYTRGLVGMFSFIIMLSTLTVILPYALSSIVELVIYLRKSPSVKISRVLVLTGVTVPALLYSAWAVVGLGLEIILWGVCLLLAGIPLYLMLKSKKRHSI